MKLTFLGTSCMVPTRDRNHSAAFLELEPHGILIDCGEGTQKQFKIAEIRPTRITHILISHWHGDHVLGLPGLLQTLSAMNPGQEITLVGPVGTKKQIGLMMQAFLFEPDLKLEVIEAKENPIISNSTCDIEYQYLDHGIPTIGFKIIQKDKIKIDTEKLKQLGLKDGPWLNKILNGESVTIQDQTVTPKDVIYTQKGKILSFVTDTVMCKGCYDLAQDADVLVCESSYKVEHEEKALQFNHLTTAQAAQLASQTNVEKLIITHFSQRYKSPEELVEEAKSIFPNTMGAFDFMKLKI